MSQNIAVRWRRFAVSWSPVAGTAAPGAGIDPFGSAPPQPPQNRIPSGLSSPQ